MRFHVLHVSRYCAHHQVLRASKITIQSAVPRCTGQCLIVGNALYKYLVCVKPFCYKMYQTFLKIFNTFK
jgi:hypothetical protein